MKLTMKLTKLFSVILCVALLSAQAHGMGPVKNKIISLLKNKTFLLNFKNSVLPEFKEKFKKPLSYGGKIVNGAREIVRERLDIDSEESIFLSMPKALWQKYLENPDKFKAYSMTVAGGCYFVSKIGLAVAASTPVCMGVVVFLILGNRMKLNEIIQGQDITHEELEKINVIVSGNNAEIIKLQEELGLTREEIKNGFENNDEKLLALLSGQKNIALLMLKENERIFLKLEEINNNPGFLQKLFGINNVTDQNEQKDELKILFSENIKPEFLCNNELPDDKNECDI
ncbi:hypothetical protein KAH94_03875 [bacterium]|nr:hypothetical protein [bacterium]